MMESDDVSHDRQFTKCESATTSTCINPEIKYGSTAGGLPKQHSQNDYDEWCKQLGGTGYYDVDFGSRSVTGGELFWCSGGDNVKTKWCDWSGDSKWKSTDANHGRGGTGGNQIVTSITCE